jgi:hypothetical protein
MKKMSFLRKFAATSMILASSVFVISSCDDNDDGTNDNMYTISGSASGSQEVPAVTTSATATLTGSYNASNNRLDYTINWTGLSGVISVAHFHGPAMAGATAGPIHDISITTNGVNGSTSGSITVADSTENHLLNGKVYYNLHTVANVNGEIRGQVSLTQQ